MTICPIALAVGCEKCPAFKFCPLTTVLGDQQEEDEIDSSNKVWEESFPPEKNKWIEITGKDTFNTVKSKLKGLEDEIDASNKVWEENFPPKKNKNEDAGEE